MLAEGIQVQIYLSFIQALTSLINCIRSVPETTNEMSHR